MGPMPAWPTSCDIEQVSMSPQGPDPASVTCQPSLCWDVSALVGAMPPNSDSPAGLTMDKAAVSGHVAGYGAASRHHSVLPWASLLDR